MKKIKYIKRQDSGFKLSYGNSGETSLNLSNEIFNFISQGNLPVGEEKDITFRIYKEDCIKAMSFIIMKLPLYKSSSNYSNKVEDYLITFDELYSRISSFFGNKQNTEYTVSLYYRPDGRIYLKGLRVQGFSIRDYLVENWSALQFDNESGEILNLRILSDIEDNSETADETETAHEEILRHQSAATFLRKALKVVIGEDASLSRLASLNKYKGTNKQLKINGFNLWRRKDDLPLRLEDVDQEIEIVYNGLTYVMYLEWTPADMEHMFFPVFNNAYDGMFRMNKEGNDYVLYRTTKSNTVKKSNESRQQIFYGAPGTGKSFGIKDLTEYKEVIRTTFHPDSDYSTFVGVYKPTTIDADVVNIMGREAVNVKNADGSPRTEKKIIYEFVPQAFLQAYVSAWKLYAEAQLSIVPQTPKEQFLIIEEINRGNCAQIFGDLFQLLDRDKDGFSDYYIKADKDLQKYLNKEFRDVEIHTPALCGKSAEDVSKMIKEGDILLLPSNLYIWATMNTSDQSLFPIDSAFKRRWEWVYKPIGYKNTNWIIKIGAKEYCWVDFQKEINQRIFDVDNSEDKQLGDYFVNADRTNNIITADTLLNKVLFYLWNDVCKDDPDHIFRWKDDNQEKSIKFSDFFCEESERDKKLQGFMSFIQVKAIGEPDGTQTPAEDDDVVNA